MAQTMDTGAAMGRPLKRRYSALTAPKGPTAAETPPLFWDRLAERYAAKPVSDPEAYAHTLDRVRAHLKPTDRVLEVGCGTGTTALHLAPHVAEVRATDYAPGMVSIAVKKAAAQGVGNATFGAAGAAEPQPGGPYDAVMAFNLLHLMPDLDGTLAALRAQVRPGGLFISKTVCLGGQGWHFPAMIGAMRLFGKAPWVGYIRPDDLVRRIADAGFEIVETGTFPKKPPSRFVVARRR